MPASRRRIIANRVYALEFRTKEGLPFTTLRLIRLLLASAIARSQRDVKVVLSHSLFMPNHPHMILKAQDAEQCTRFYSEVKKKITDYMKRLLGLDHLELWESRGSVLEEILDLDALVKKIAYLYANPAKAGLVDSIDDYPGFSSWAQFKQNPQADTHQESVPWVRQRTIPRLSKRRLEGTQDRILTERLIEMNKHECHDLIVHPNACWEAFGITDPDEIAELNKAVFAEIAEREAEYRAKRAEEGKPAKGAARLKAEPIFKAHTPKHDSGGCKVLYYTTVQELALEYLETFRAFCEECREAYRAWRRGEYNVQWPPGAFRPPICPAANAL